MKEGYRALSACHTEALVQSACTEKNDKKKHKEHRAFALPRALINTIVSRGDEGPLFFRESARQGEYSSLPSCSLSFLSLQLLSISFSHSPGHY